MKGIIFDLDGTMVDNMMVHHRAWQRILADLGMDMPLEEVMQKVHGINNEILLRLFGDRFTEDQRQEISDRKEAQYREIFKPDLKLLDGLPGFLEEARENNIPMGIGTAASIENLSFVLDNLDLRGYFKVAFHSGDVTKGKPDPEVFLKVAEAMKVDARDCVVFEDSVVGATAGVRAGSKVIAVTTTHPKDDFKDLPIHLFIDNFTGVSVSQLLTN